MRVFLKIGLVLFLWQCHPKQNTVVYSNSQELGAALFNEPILSRDSSVSCASCHLPQFAFADTSITSKGVQGRLGNRNTPSAMNLAEHTSYFWDGRAETLEMQALGPISNPLEMDLPLSSAIRRLKSHPIYREAFYKIYGEAPNALLLSKALADFERSLETSDTPFDRYMQTNDTLLFKSAAQRGLEIFNTKGKCFDCHFGSDFTGNDRFKNIGLYNQKDLNDPGRAAITGNSKDLGAFKTPGLRNIALTAPYMHNGMFKTLYEVVEYYNFPDKKVSNALGRDPLLNQPLGLTEQEKTDLVSFLESLTDLRFKSTAP